MYKILMLFEKRIMKTKYYSTKTMFDKWKVKYTSRYGGVYIIECYILKNDKWKKA